MNQRAEISDGVELWAGEFGVEYTDRNRVNWRNRIKFWDTMIELIGVRSVLEVGCNAGWNLSALRVCEPTLALYGTDINPVAVDQARVCGLNVECKLDFDAAFRGKMELVFTAGVLIHVEPENLKEFMSALASKSCRYVLAVEYASDVEEEIPYQGMTGKCWKRPYGKLYEELGLRLVYTGDAGEGFDRCTFWLLEK